MTLVLGDYHVHSTFSDDAVSTIAENIAAASAAGLTHLRLIDHVRASTTWVPEFVAAVAAETVPDGLTILTGVEAKMLDASGTLDIPAGLTGVDAIVIADHQFPGNDGAWSPSVTRERMAAGLATSDVLPAGRCAHRGDALRRERPARPLLLDPPQGRPEREPVERRAA